MDVSRKDKGPAFSATGRRHFKELDLDEDRARRMVTDADDDQSILWSAIPDPRDPAVPPMRHRRPVLFLVCHLPPDALNHPLAEVLLGPDEYGHPEVFHLYRLTDIWQRYWLDHDPQAPAKMKRWGRLNG